MYGLYFSGYILTWNLSKNSKQKWQLFNEGRHSRIVFNICHCVTNDVIVTLSMDRQVSEIVLKYAYNADYVL